MPIMPAVLKSPSIGLEEERTADIVAAKLTEYGCEMHRGRISPTCCKTVPGAMIWLGNGSGEDACYLHNAKYDLNDTALAYGVSFFVRLAERFFEKTET
jgi:metal-dependent amidase/aminoacylase/carboxypeptidase family protein